MHVGGKKKSKTAIIIIFLCPFLFCPQILPMVTLYSFKSIDKETESQAALQILSSGKNSIISSYDSSANQVFIQVVQYGLHWFCIVLIFLKPECHVEHGQVPHRPKHMMATISLSCYIIHVPHQWESILCGWTLQAFKLYCDFFFPASSTMQCEEQKSSEHSLPHPASVPKGQAQFLCHKAALFTSLWLQAVVITNPIIKDAAGLQRTLTGVAMD